MSDICSFTTGHDIGISWLSERRDSRRTVCYAAAVRVFENMLSDNVLCNRFTGVGREDIHFPLI